MRVSISAVAEKGYAFSSWTGNLVGSENPSTIRPADNKSITAIFNPTSTNTGQSSFHWWLWAIVGLVGLLGVLILMRLVYAKMNRGVWDEPDEFDR